MDVLVRIERAVLAGRVAFAFKARAEMAADGMTEVKPMLRITECPTCGSSKISRVRRDWTETFEGET